MGQGTLERLMVITDLTDKELVGLYYETRKNGPVEKYRSIITEMAQRAKVNNNPILTRALNELCLGKSAKFRRQ